MYLSSRATGDGVRLARAAGAAVGDLHNVQVHPTAFVRALNVGADGVESLESIERETSVAAAGGGRRTLCAEILRGVGGILLDATGKRFVDELDTRKNVVERMNARAQQLRDASGGVPPGKCSDEFVLVLGSSAAQQTSHATAYTHKRLLVEFASLDALARWMHVAPRSLLNELQVKNTVACVFVCLYVTRYRVTSLDRPTT